MCMCLCLKETVEFDGQCGNRMGQNSANIDEEDETKYIKEQ